MKLSQAIKMCLNYKVLAGILAIIVLLYLFVPQFANFAWILLVLVCPLSMIFMMAGMKHANNQSAKEEKNEGDIEHHHTT